MKTKLLKRLSVVLSLVLLLICVLTDTAEAANKVFAVPYSFKDLRSKDWEENGKANTYSIALPGPSKKTSLKGLKMGATVYVPKKSLKKKGSSVEFQFHLNIRNKNKFEGSTRPGISVGILNEKGKVRMFAVDEKTFQETKASKYADFQSGKGKYKDYYIVTLKNIPLYGEITKGKLNRPWDKTGKTTNINWKKNYQFDVELSVFGGAQSSSGTLYLDNFTLKSGSKKLVNHTFSKNLKSYEVYNRGKAMSHKKVKIVKW